MKVLNQVSPTSSTFLTSTGKNQKNKLESNFLFTVRYPAKLVTFSAPFSGPTLAAFCASLILPASISGVRNKGSPGLPLIEIHFMFG